MSPIINAALHLLVISTFLNGYITLVSGVDVQVFDKELARAPRSTRAANEHHVQKRATASCPLISDISKLDSGRNKHVFANDSNPSLSLTWSGTEGVLLALTTMSGILSSTPSRLYRSTNRGKSFTDISDQIQHDSIGKASGIHVNPLDSKHIILIGYNSPFAVTWETKLYITTDAGANFIKSVCPFTMDASSLLFNPRSLESLLVKSTDHNHALWLSTDFGRKWVMVHEYVISAKWDPTKSDKFYYVVDPLKKMSKLGNDNELYADIVGGSTKTLIAQHIHSFAVQDSFIFLSVQFPGNNGSRVMHVSKDHAVTWNAAQLPLINAEQFYSILDMSEDMVFVHVDTRGDTGHGSIFTSDERGIIYSESLKRHLYPNSKGITDFYKVLSLPGVYITSQLSDENTVHSLMTFDKGGVWNSVQAPAGSKCPSTEKVCNLQIHNYFSVSKHVRLPALPLSSSSATGIIIAHGNIGDGLNFNPPDVYLTSDGGYTWQQPEELKGPHFYGIGDSGGILFAIKSTYGVVNTLKFSLDEGRCWHSYNFTDRPIQVTGMSSEPGEKSTDISIWGWDRNGDGSWMAITVELRAIMGSLCSNSDYEKWQAHETSALNDNQCNLGMKKFFFRRRKGTVCINQNQLVQQQTDQPCLCKKSDFLCDYGYKRVQGNSECVADPVASTSKMDICINDEEELIETKGYRKIPGDKCSGGFEPITQLKVVAKSCAKVEQSEDNFAVDPNTFETYDQPHNSSDAGLIIFLVVAVLALGTGLGVLLYRKRKSVLKIRYTPLSQDDASNGAVPRSLVGTATVVDDGDDAIIVDPSAAAKVTNGATLSYHDDSDEDLLVT